MDEVLPFAQARSWADAAMQQQQWKMAAQRWAILRKTYPQEIDSWVKAALCHQRAKQIDAAETLLQEAMARFPDKAAGVLGTINVALDQGDLCRAEQLIQAAQTSFGDDHRVLLAAADLACRQGRTQEAAHLNARARELCTTSPEPWVQYAEFAMRSRNWAEALLRWAEVRQKFPNLPAAYHRAATAAEQMGNPRQARQLRAAREYGCEWLENAASPKIEKNPLRQHDTAARHNLRTFFNLVLTKGIFNLKSEASQNYLHYLWWLIDPLLYMTVFYVFFGLILHRGGENFLAYLLTGIIPFQWFAKTIAQSANSIVAGRGLMYQVRLFPMFFPLVAVIQNIGKQIPVFILLVCFLMLMGLHPTIYWLGFLPIVLVQLVVISTLSCLIAMFVPFVRDLVNIVPTGIQFLLFCSGVFYELNIIPIEWRTVFLMNPMANILYQYRRVFVYQSWPDWHLLGGLALACFAVLLLVIAGYRRLEPAFPRVVLE
jgi:lipopolysaccharide transport system permease protein